MNKQMVKMFGVVVAGVVSAGYLMYALKDVKVIGDAKNGFNS